MSPLGQIRVHIKIRLLQFKTNINFATFLMHYDGFLHCRFYTECLKIVLKIFFQQFVCLHCCLEARWHFIVYRDQNKTY